MDDPKDFKDRFGRLLFVLYTDVEDGLLCTLVHFYDPVYRCFTFPDYQLFPTMEEYPYLLGMLVYDRVPFSGVEGILESRVIAEAIHLRKFDIDVNLTVKGDKLSHQYNTRANQLKKMDHLEQENRELRKEVTTLRGSYEMLTTMMETLVAAQNQPPPSPQTSLQRTVISKIVSTPIFMAPVSALQHYMPSGFPWGMPHNFMPEGYQPAVEVPMAQPVMSIPPLVVHGAPYVKEPIFHVDQSETVGVYERMDEF
ncbi:uncharacterized protein LOC127101873 [Lathyrus oleraceus]|uniref:uncharacterized protein LOC127101873 n=1 Tax=Pisum sativum TaxID=3888 RepID=UPI0021CEAD7E|nr:uncharacterized protein LOC127101873 [Pisum sativum]